MTTISFKITEQDNELIRKCAEIKGINLSDFIRTAVMEQIEDEYDLEIFDKVFKTSKGEETYSFDEVKRDVLG